MAMTIPTSSPASSTSTSRRHDVDVATPRDRKRQRVRLLQRYLLNPPVKGLVWAGLLPGHALLETTGRKTGKRRRTVVGMQIVGRTGWVIAEHGRRAGYVANLVADPDVRIRVGRRWRQARAVVVDADDAQARLDGFGRRAHASAVRRFGTDLTTIRCEFVGEGPGEAGPGDNA